MERQRRRAHVARMKAPVLLGCTLAAAMSLAACATIVQPPAALSARDLTDRRCGGCHAIGLDGASPHPDAPPLRDLFRRYPIYALPGALLQGVEVGHRDMPRFILEPEETAAIMSYLDSINPCARPSSDDAAMERCFGPD